MRSQGKQFKVVGLNGNSCKNIFGKRCVESGIKEVHKRLPTHSEHTPVYKSWGMGKVRLSRATLLAWNGGLLQRNGWGDTE